MRIAICGVDGFLGEYLGGDLISKGYEVVFVSKIHLKNTKKLASLLEGCYGIVNLCGVPLLKRWNEEYKKEIYDSRIQSVKSLVDACFLMETPPEFFISLSSVYIYTNTGIHDENSAYFGIDYLSFLAKDWEKEAKRAKELGIRVVIMRLGEVLGCNGGIVKELKNSIKSFVCKIPGDGKQGFAWIDIEDIAKFVNIAVKDEKVEGVYNLVSPEMVNISEFFKRFAKILKRPVWKHMPIDILKFKYKEGYEVLLKSSFVKSKRLEEINFEFSTEKLEDALKKIKY